MRSGGGALGRSLGGIEGAQFIAEYIIEVTTGAFDDFASADTDENLNMRLLGLD